MKTSKDITREFNRHLFTDAPKPRGFWSHAVDFLCAGVLAFSLLMLALHGLDALFY